MNVANISVLAISCKLPPNAYIISHRPNLFSERERQSSPCSRLRDLKRATCWKRRVIFANNLLRFNFLKNEIKRTTAWVSKKYPEWILIFLDTNIRIHYARTKELTMNGKAWKQSSVIAADWTFSSFSLFSSFLVFLVFFPRSPRDYVRRTCNSVAITRFDSDWRFL